MKQTRVSFDISSIFRAHAAQIELRTSGNLTGARTEAQRAAQTYATERLANSPSHAFEEGSRKLHPVKFSSSFLPRGD